MRPIPILTAILLALGAIEGLAWWWMHPAPAGLGEPVLVYRPSRSVGVSPTREKPGTGDQESGIRRQEDAPAQSSASTFNVGSSEFKVSSSIPPSSSPSSDLRLSDLPTFDSSLSASTHTPLPEIYRQAAPMLRCTSGQVFHVKIDDTASLYGAFFEWDDTDTGSVLEAFRHMPEACMGSIGMQLVSKEKPIPYQVGLARQAGRDPANGAESESEGRSQESVGLALRAGRDSANGAESQRIAYSPAQSTSSSPDLRPSDLQASDTPSSSSIPASQHFSVSASTSSLLFDHTIFRDPGQSGAPFGPGPLVHAFRAVWVAGTPAADARSGLAGRGFDQLRGIRLTSALTRYRPSHARVIQGAVRGTPNAQAAWAAFEQAMLRHLTFER